MASALSEDWLSVALEEVDAGLGSVPSAGSATLISTEDPGALSLRIRWALADAESHESRGHACRLLVQTWREEWRHRALLDAAVSHLAEAALRTWPFWYGTDWKPGWVEEPPPLLQIREELLQQATQAADVSSRWVDGAWRLAASDRLPVPDGFPHSTALRQLALTLSAQESIVVWELDVETLSGRGAESMARAAEWFARHSGARLVLATRPELAESEGFSGLSSHCVELPIEHAETSKEEAPAEVSPPSSIALFPMPEGRPHPFSPGENLLAERLQADAEMSGLFQCNQMVISDYGSRFCIDFLWAAGRLAIEVDGFTWHSSRLSFAEDRRRDFELLVSGYVVVRLPHDLVMHRTDEALERIRRAVATRASLTSTLSPDPHS